MADDLVKRLRDHCFSTDWQVAVADSREAADRIEKLEAALRIVMELSRKRSTHPMSPEADYFCIAGAALEGQDGEKV